MKIQLLSNGIGVFINREPINSDGRLGLVLFDTSGEKVSKGSLAVNGSAVQTNTGVFPANLKQGINTLTYAVGTARYRIEPLSFNEGKLTIESLVGTETQYIGLTMAVDKLKLELTEAKGKIALLEEHTNGYKIF